MADTKRVTAKNVIELLKARYPGPAFAFLEQVADGTGARQNRWADAVAMSVWPSRGYHLDGFEVKVSRSDWLSELRNPAKADALMKYCDHWWLVTGSEGIVQAGELPPTWGLMEVKGGKLKVSVCAPSLTPAPMDVALVASLLRNSARADADMLTKEYQRGERDGREHGGRSDRERLAEVTRSVAEFEKASGIWIERYSGPEIGKIVGVMRQMKFQMQTVLRAQNQAARIAETLKELAELPGFEDFNKAVAEEAAD